MSTILVTGVNGFVGKHLVRELRSQDHSVFGVGNSAVDPEIASLLSNYECCDLTDAEQVEKLNIKSIDAVISLAGLVAQGRASFGSDDEYNKPNVDMLLLLSERFIRSGLNPRVIAVSTGLVYDPYQPMPYTETSPLTEKGSPYVSSKLCMEEAAHELRRKNLDCVIARPFNHSGPGQGLGYIIPDIYHKLVAFQQDGIPVPVSPKSTKRDYADVRDIVKGYAVLATKEKLDFDTYNLCTGKSHSAEDILNIMQQAMGIKDVETIIDVSFARPNDPVDLYGSYDRIFEETGWKPTIAFETTLQDYIKASR